MAPDSKSIGYLSRPKPRDEPPSPFIGKDGLLDGLKISLQDRKFEKADRLISNGINLLEKGFEDLASACFSRALRFDSDNVAGWNNKGVCSLRTGEYQQAVRYFEKAMHIDPDYQLALINKSIALLYIDEK
jgi:lipoprotein NlpI